MIAHPAGAALRRQLLAKVHIAKKQLAMDEDTWRDMLQTTFGVSSSGTLTPARLVELIEHLKGLGFTDRQRLRRVRSENLLVSRETSKGGNDELVAKMRAQWMSLYHLGLVKQPDDDALLKFAKRQTKSGTPGGAGVQALQWITAPQGHQIIEALKAMGARAGVVWSEHKNPRACVLAAQARRCVELGIFQYAAQISARTFSYWGRTDWTNLADSDMDQLITILGSDIRLKLMELAR